LRALRKRPQAGWPTQTDPYSGVQHNCLLLTSLTRLSIVKPARGYESLRRSRVTIPGASYFLTLCTYNRTIGLDQPAIAGAIQEQILSLERDAAFVLQAAVIMPDHLHLLGIVPGPLNVGQIVGRLKAKTRPVLQVSDLRWQGNFFEHRIGPVDSLGDVLRYLFLNPYRARLLPPTEVYPWFWLGPSQAAWFRPTLNDDRPFPSWLG
jgi:putative transposase